MKNTCVFSVFLSNFKLLACHAVTFPSFPTCGPRRASQTYTFYIIYLVKEQGPSIVSPRHKGSCLAAEWLALTRDSTVFSNANIDDCCLGAILAYRITFCHPQDQIQAIFDFQGRIFLIPLTVRREYTGRATAASWFSLLMCEWVRVELEISKCT